MADTSARAWVPVLRDLTACGDPLRWLETVGDAAVAWRSCLRPDWIAWALARVGVDRDKISRALWECVAAVERDELSCSEEDAATLARAFANPWPSETWRLLSASGLPSACLPELLIELLLVGTGRRRVAEEAGDEGLLSTAILAGQAAARATTAVAVLTDEPAEALAALEAHLLPMSGAAAAQDLPRRALERVCDALRGVAPLETVLEMALAASPPAEGAEAARRLATACYWSLQGSRALSQSTPAHDCGGDDCGVCAASRLAQDAEAREYDLRRDLELRGVSQAEQVRAVERLRASRALRAFAAAGVRAVLEGDEGFLEVFAFGEFAGVRPATTILLDKESG